MKHGNCLLCQLSIPCIFLLLARSLFQCNPNLIFLLNGNVDNSATCDILVSRLPYRIVCTLEICK